MRTDKYIRVKVIGLVPADAWVQKPEEGNGAIVPTREDATLFTEQAAFEVRKSLIAQVPDDVTVTFDL